MDSRCDRPPCDEPAPLAALRLAGAPATRADAASPPSRGAPDDLSVIDEELERLRQGRAYFYDWVREFRAQDPADRRGLSPWAFLRAWNDSTTRIIQLLRARRMVAPEREHALDLLLESIYDELEHSMATPDAVAPEGPPSGEPAPGPAAEEAQSTGAPDDTEGAS